MNIQQKKQNLLLLTSISLLTSILVGGSALAANSTITVTSTPFLSFTDVPEPVSIGSLSVPTADTEITSDGDGNLPQERYLRIKDTRACGGLNLQIQANNFIPATTPELKNNLRIVTASANFLDGPVSGGVKYLLGFTGQQGIVAPLNVSGLTFSDPTLFTASPFDVTDNTLDSPLDLLQGNLTAPNGRNGEMQIDVSFYMLIPKFTPPNEYYTTLTLTLSDDTTGVCP